MGGTLTETSSDDIRDHILETKGAGVVARLDELLLVD
jgi:hypothetical protein